MTGFRAFGSPLKIAPASFLGANPPVVIDKADGMMPRQIGEPSLTSALALLSVEEAADYRAWGQREKLMFLTGYQYVATATAAGLRRADGTPFDGFLTQGISVILSAMEAAQGYFKRMPAEAAAAADQAASVLKEASTKTEPRGIEFAKKYALLRDRAAWELATQNDLTIEYEILGTDPANPGMVYTRKIGEDKAPDYSAVFSTRTPSELYNDGLTLQDKFEALGVTFKRLDTLGVNLRMGVGPAPLLVILIILIVAILAFFLLTNNVIQKNRLLKLSEDQILGDPNLSPSEKADKLMKIHAGLNFLNEIFGPNIPWTGILITLGLGVLALLAYPYVAEALQKKPSGYLSHERARPHA